VCTYAKDAMHGLSLVERLMDGAAREGLEREVEALIAADAAGDAAVAAMEAPAEPGRAAVRRDLPAPVPADLDRHVAELDLDAVWSYLNPQMVYGKHLGLKGSVKKLAAEGDEKLAKLQAVIGELQDLGRRGAMRARAVWRFFPAVAEGERLTLVDPESSAAVAAWDLPRQARAGAEKLGLCLTDYVLPGDCVALFVTTAGEGVRERVEGWKQAGEYLKSHAFAALALETAEAAAECVHAAIRAAWGFPDPPGAAREDLLTARYRGKRYSFGYPACPDLAMQRQLFAALKPEEIGVTLTEGDMMEPEASVSALVFEHPDARYFAV
jgi:5-methyltetrahydrofolate--homocysteine methyltransferase